MHWIMTTSGLYVFFLKFFDGLKPTVKLGELGLFKKSYLFSKSIISFFNLSYSESDMIGDFYHNKQDYIFKVEKFF